MCLFCWVSHLIRQAFNASIVYDTSDIGEYEVYGGKKCLNFNQRPKQSENMQFGAVADI